MMTIEINEERVIAYVSARIEGKKKGDKIINWEFLKEQTEANLDILKTEPEEMLAMFFAASIEITAEDIAEQCK